MLFQSGCERCLAARGETGCCPNNFASSSSSFQPSGNGQPTPAASARSRYSWTVLSPIRQLRAICRCPNLNSNRNRRTSLTFRMDDLLAGTLFSLCMEFSMPRYCPALLRPSSAHLRKTFRSKTNTIPVDEQNCSPSHRDGARLQTETAFAYDRIPQGNTLRARFRGGDQESQADLRHQRDERYWNNRCAGKC